MFLEYTLFTGNRGPAKSVFEVGRHSASPLVQVVHGLVSGGSCFLEDVQKGREKWSSAPGAGEMLIKAERL